MYEIKGRLVICIYSDNNAFSGVTSRLASAASVRGTQCGSEAIIFH